MSVALLVWIGWGVPAHSQIAPAASAPEASYFGGRITLRLVAPSEVRQGEWLEGLDMVITNHGSDPFAFHFSGDLRDFHVLDPEGRVLWKALSFYQQPRIAGVLAPGESRMVSEVNGSAHPGRWDLRSQDGFPAEPGVLQLKGIVTLSAEDPGPGTESHRLETPVHDLVIHEAPLPAYARSLQLELIVPTEVRVNDTTPMDLRVTNTGDQQIGLLWSQINMIPTPHHLDIVISRDGEEIWRATHAHNIRSSGASMLEAGESRLMSDIFREADQLHQANCDRVPFPNCRDPVVSVPGEWDQRVSCGQYGLFEPCAESVGPGVYTVQAMVNVSSPLESGERVTVVTEPHQLTIIQ